MKYLVTALSLITLTFVVQSGFAVAQTVSIAAKLQQLETQLQSQLEKIKYARDVADRSTSLAKIRIARELRRSEAEMERQIEILERLKEQMKDQTGESPSSLTEIKDAWNNALQTAISGLSQQIQTTSLLLSRMESFRANVEDGSEDNASSDSRPNDMVPYTPSSGGTSDLPTGSPCSGQGTGNTPTIPTLGSGSPSTCPLEQSWNVR